MFSTDTIQLFFAGLVVSVSIICLLWLFGIFLLRWVRGDAPAARSQFPSAPSPRDFYRAQDFEGGAFSPYQPLYDMLTRREREIAQLIAAGKSDEQIAEQLVISIRTAETHAYNIFRKMRIRQRSELKHIVPKCMD